MPLESASGSFTGSWSVHDSWSEAFVGIRRLVYELLPQPSVRQSAEDGALCQLALIGSNHLMEVALYKLLQPFTLASSGGIASLTAALLDEASYHHMLSRWLPAACGKHVDLQAQPYKSTEALRRRRNAVVHKSSAPTTVPMARAALFSSIQGCRAVFAHAGVAFPYEGFIQKSGLTTVRLKVEQDQLVSGVRRGDLGRIGL
jgi:hypothetical protein